MSGAIGTAVVAGVGGMVAAQMMAPDTSIPSPASPTPPPQASSAPDANVVRQNQAGTGQAGGAPGVAQTMLTGAGGVDPNALNLGKKTLLGS